MLWENGCIHIPYINIGKRQKELTRRYLPDKAPFILFEDLIPQIQEEALG